MPSWKLWLRRGLAAVVLLIVVIASLLAGLLLPYLLAAWSAKIWLLAVNSVCAFAVIAWGGAWLSLPSSGEQRGEGNSPALSLHCVQ